MAEKAEGRGSGRGYFLRFAGTALLLVAATLVLVLIVLPQRYVLSAGFRESGVGFPSAQTPFAPPQTVQVPARTLTTTPTTEVVVRGPAEIFWDQVTPLLEERRFGEAFPLFERYLDEHPSDLDVRREYAVTLLAADRAADAVPVLSAMVEARDDRDVRLLLARTLRDLGLMEQASGHYRHLSALDPDDLELRLEWARALSAASDYAAAERVLEDALERDPGTVPLRVELARIYYYTNRLVDAELMLASLTDRELAEADAFALREGVRAALAVPEAEPAVPPTLLEQAVAAREEDDFEAASRLFEEALAAEPNSAEAWQAYADFLQYELSDLEGARQALLEVERLTMGGTPELQLRLAQLEIWGGHFPEAEARLLAELSRRRSPDGALGGEDVADILALLGDVYRWEGRRLAAVEQYELALASDSDHDAAREGLEEVREEVIAGISEVERPRFGARAASLSDTDDFDRFDAGAEWRDMSEEWVWGVEAGSRWVHGFDLLGAPDEAQGAFVEAEVARWWRWGTLRTAFRFGMEDLGPGEMDVLAGASLRFVDQGGGRTDLSAGREPAHLRTNTLQSVQADLVEDRVAASHTRPLGERWSVAASAEVGSLGGDLPAGDDAGFRLAGALSVGRAVGPLTLGLTTGVTGFTEAAPGPGGVRLYWDPRSAVSIGLYAMMSRSIAESWTLNARLGSGVARLDERGASGIDFVPQLSVEAGLARDWARYRAALDLFCYQGRFDGYRAYGMTLSLSARAGFRPEEPR